MSHSNEAEVSGITFRSSIDKTNEQILRAAVRYLLLQVRDKTETIPKEVDVTPWLERE